MSLDPTFRLSDFAADKVKGATNLAREHNLLRTHFSHGKTLTTTGLAISHAVSNGNLERYLSKVLGMVSMTEHPVLTEDSLTIPAQVVNVLGQPMLIDEKVLDLTSLLDGTYQVDLEWWHSLIGPTTTGFPKSFGSYTGVTNTQNKLSSTQLYSRGHVESASGVSDDPLVTFKVEAERHEQLQYRIKMRAESSLFSIRSADLLNPADAAVVEAPLPGTYRATSLSSLLGSFEITPSATADERAIDRTFYIAKLCVVIKQGGVCRMLLNDARKGGLIRVSATEPIDDLTTPLAGDLLAIVGQNPIPVVLSPASFSLKVHQKLKSLKDDLAVLQGQNLDDRLSDLEGENLPPRVLGLENGGAFKPGMIMMWAGPVAPDGWLLCQGQTVARASYPNLFAAIGTFYGGGDGVTTFTLPDLASRFPLGPGSGDDLTTRSRGQKGGQEFITDVPAHSHNYLDTIISENSGSIPPGGTTGYTNYTPPNGLGSNGAGDVDNTAWARVTTTSPAGESQVDIMPPFLVIPFIIKI